jgi:hypothetical protein
MAFSGRPRIRGLQVCGCGFEEEAIELSTAFITCVCRAFLITPCAHGVMQARVLWSMMPIAGTGKLQIATAVRVNDDIP